MKQKKEVIIDDDKRKIYMKNNNLIKSKYDITAAENKLYMFLSDKVKRSGDAKNNEYAKIIFKREELFDVFKGQLKEPARISKVFSKLIKRSIFIYEQKPNGKERWGEYVFLSSYRYDQEADEFVVVMNTQISELIVQHYLNTGYTPMNLDVIYGLDNIYAQRFYELLRLWTWTGNKIVYSVSELKEYLRLENKKSYNNFSNFNKKVIEPAVEALNDSGLFEITYKPIKKSRAVTAIEFTVKDLDDRIYFKNNKKDENVVKTIQEDDVVIKEEFYIPNKEVFTEASLKRIKKDFNEYDFKAEGFEEVFDDAVMYVMEKDNANKITYRNYNLFKSVLKKKLDNFDFKRGYNDAEQMFMFKDM